MPGLSLLERQIEKSTQADGSIDYVMLKRLVAEAYDDKELDRRRADRASRLVAEELEETLNSLEVQNLRFKLDMHTCGECKRAEYACICDH